MGKWVLEGSADRTTSDNTTHEETQGGTILAAKFDWDLVAYPPRRVSSFASLNYGKSLTEPNRRSGEIPMFGTNGQCGWHDTALSNGPGIILGRKGQGHLGVVWCDSPFWVIDTAYYAEVDKTCVDLKWFYYITRYVGLDELKTGEKPGLSRDIFGRQRFPFPPLPEQRAIARVLGALDDKIELNRRMNRTLEDLARGLFRSWFVDFDPVVKNGGGRAAGAPAGSASTRSGAASRSSEETKPPAGKFPKRLVDSPLGPIPEAWRVGTVADLARYVNGRNFTKNATGTGRMVVRIAELNSGPGGSTVCNDVKAEAENVVHPGELLFAWSGSLDVYRWHRDEALVNQHIFKVVCETYPQWFVHFHLCDAMPFFQGIAADKATTMGHIKREHLGQAELALPGESELAYAGKQIEPMYMRILTNERESLRLAALRDALLPQLLSGELRLPDAERIVEGVA